MAEHRLFDPDNPPEWLDPEWWRDRPHCDHLGSPTGTHVARLKAAAHHAQVAASLANNSAVVDLCAGDGALLSLLNGPFRGRSWGYDIIRADVEYARLERGVEVHLRNVRRGLEDGGMMLAPVVVLTEALEHMADPHGFLKLLTGREDSPRYVVASSPAEETEEQHEWNHAWAWDEHGYVEMFRAAGFDPLAGKRIEWSQVWTFGRLA